MKSTKLGILSAAMASVCCLGPIVLILAGLGGIGVGALLGRYHWYFIVGAAALLIFAWLAYFREKKVCNSVHCEMGGKRVTRNILILASVVVLTFAGLNFYTYAKKTETLAFSSGIQVSIPVKGMSCFTCEIAVQSAVKMLSGVHDVKASAREGVAIISYDCEETSLDEIVAAINGTGYKAQKLRI